MSCYGEDCDCKDYSVNELYRFVERIESTKHVHSLMYVRNKQWGFDACNEFENFKWNKELDLYVRVLNRNISARVLGGEGAIGCKDMRKMVQRVNELVQLYPCGESYDYSVEVDKSGLNSWTIANPTCVPRQRWEFCLLKEAPKLRVTATDRSSNCTNIVYTLAVEKILCDLTYQIQQTPQDVDCKIEFDILKNDIDCDIDYTLYKSIRDCGVTDGIVRQVLECGLRWGWRTTEAQPCIIQGTDELLLGELNELNLPT